MCHRRLLYLVLFSAWTSWITFGKSLRNSRAVLRLLYFLVLVCFCLLFEIRSRPRIDTRYNFLGAVFFCYTHQFLADVHISRFVIVGYWVGYFFFRIETVWREKAIAPVGEKKLWSNPYFPSCAEWRRVDWARSEDVQEHTFARPAANRCEYFSISCPWKFNNRSSTYIYCTIYVIGTKNSRRRSIFYSYALSCDGVDVMKLNFVLI